ncbi:MAG: AprI/Inh family metalloprotease inhibitor [Methylobacterium sp.]
MPRQLLSTAALLALAVQLGACGSGRFEGPSARAPRLQPPPEPYAAAPSGAVTSAPLAPPPGATASAEPLGADIVASVPPPVVSEPVLPPAPAPVVATGRSSVIGGWNATDANGSCRVSLSSTPALDLYRASTSGCANKELAKVTSWDFREGEVYLYQSGGTVAARLKQANGSLDGALSKSGAALTLAR